MNLLPGGAPGKLRLRDMNPTGVQRRNLHLKPSGLGGEDVNVETEHPLQREAPWRHV